MLKKVLFTLGLAMLLSPAAFAGKKIEVAVGDTISAAKVVATHNVSVANLEKGQREFKLKVGKKVHKLTLTDDQVNDILAGSTVRTDDADGKKVRLTLKSEKPKSSGW